MMRVVHPLSPKHLFYTRGQPFRSRKGYEVSIGRCSFILPLIAMEDDHLLLPTCPSDPRALRSVTRMEEVDPTSSIDSSTKISLHFALFDMHGRGFSLRRFDSF